MKSKIIAHVVKLQLPSGKAVAAKVGAVLGSKGINVPNFISDFNKKTALDEGILVNVVVTIFTDRTFEFIIKSPPTSALIKKFAGIEKGAKDTKVGKSVGKLTQSQVMEIAKIKMNDMGVSSLEAAMRSIEGTAKSMGIEIEA